MHLSGGNQLIGAEKIMDELDIKQGMLVADLGCGTAGHFVFPAAKRVGDSGKVFAADILKSVLETVENRARVDGFINIETVWTNLEIYGATKIANDTLDIAMLINVLFQTKPLENVIREAIRLIKPGGKLLIIDWKISGTPFGPKEIDRIDSEKVKSFILELNLILHKEFDAGPYHFGMIFTK